MGKKQQPHQSGPNRSPKAAARVKTTAQKNSFRAWLTQQLNKSGMTLAEVSKKADMSVAYLHHLKSGLRPVTKSVAVALAHALGISMEEVFREAGLSAVKTEFGVPNELVEQARYAPLATARADAYRQLVSLAPAYVAFFLDRAIDDPDSLVRETAVELLGDAHQLRDAHALLMKLLDHETDESISNAANRALDGLLARQEAILEELKAATASRDFLPHIVASLTGSDPCPLENRLKKGEVISRIEAIEQIRKDRDIRCVPDLMKMATDNDQPLEVRKAATTALAEIS